MENKTPTPSANIFGLLRPYASMILGLVILTVLLNGLNLVVPKIVSLAIDSFIGGYFDLNLILWQFLAVAF